MVDIGGIYFQCLFVIAFVILFALHGSPVWAYCVVAIDLSIALSLNPFLRMDGYWLLADLFGIWNLRALSLQILRYFWSILSRKPVLARNPMTGLGTKTATLVCVYSILSTMFFAGLTLMMSYQVVFVLGPAYPANALSCGAHGDRKPSGPCSHSGGRLEIHVVCRVRDVCLAPDSRSRIVRGKSPTHLSTGARTNEKSPLAMEQFVA